MTPFVPLFRLAAVMEVILAGCPTGHIFGILLDIECLRLAFGLRGDHEFFHRDDGGAEVQGGGRGHASGDVDGEFAAGGTGGLGADVVVAGRDGAKEETATGIGDVGAGGAGEGRRAPWMKLPVASLITTSRMAPVALSWARAGSRSAVRKKRT